MKDIHLRDYSLDKQISKAGQTVFTREDLKHVKAWRKAISGYKIETIITQQKLTERPPNLVATQNLMTLTQFNS